MLEKNAHNLKHNHFTISRGYHWFIVLQCNLVHTNTTIGWVDCSTKENLEKIGGYNNSVVVITNYYSHPTL